MSTIFMVIFLIYGHLTLHIMLLKNKKTNRIVKFKGILMTFYFPQVTSLVNLRNLRDSSEQCNLSKDLIAFRILGLKYVYLLNYYAKYSEITWACKCTNFERTSHSRNNFLCLDNVPVLISIVTKESAILIFF